MQFSDPLAEPLIALQTASAASWGAVFSTDNVELFKARLYKALRKAKEENPDTPLAALTIRTSPEFPDTQVWIVKSNLKETSEGTNGGKLLPSPAEEEKN